MLNSAIPIPFHHIQHPGNMKTIVLFVFAFVLQISLVLSQTILISSFDENQEDWIAEGGAIYYWPQNGNSGGFIEFEDNQDGAGVFIAPARFFGDLKAYNLGSIEFDLKNTYSNGQNLLYGYGAVTITSPYITATNNVVPLNLFSEWSPFSVPFNAESWNMTPTGWDSLISDVTRISIQMDAEWNYYDKTGLDNFAIKPSATAVESLQNGIDSRLSLCQNFPNPFTETTRIVVEVTGRAHAISLVLISPGGSEIETIYQGTPGPGKHTFYIDAGNLPKGLYLIRLTSQTQSLTRKTVIN